MRPLKSFRSFHFLLLLAGFTGLLSCSKETSPEAKLAFEGVIPKPVSANATGKAFFVKEETAIFVDADTEALTTIGNFLAGKLKPATGFDLEVKSAAEAPNEDAIFLTTKGGDAKLGEEGYELTITEDQVKIVANKPA